MADVEKDIVLRVKSETDQATGQFKNLKQELRSIEGELNKMATAGQTGTDAFKKLQQRAGEVKDQINDTKSAIKALSSDTFRLDAFAQGAQAIAGGFASAQGALALFGTENKQVEEAIKKTQGAMALLQGVTAITNVLQKESALRLAIATTAQTAYTAVVGTSTGAMKLFRLALASTGIGALVVGLGLLISNFDDVKKVVMNLLKPFDGIIAKVRDFLSVISFGLIDDSATAKTKDNAEKVVDAFNKTKDAMKESEKVIERQIELAKAQGKSTKEIYNLEKQLADLRVKNLQAEQSALKTKEKAGIATEDEKKRLKELNSEIADATNKRLILDANYQKSVADAEKKRKEEAEKRKKELEKMREYEAQWEEERTKKQKEEAEKQKKILEEQLEFEDQERKKSIEADRVYIQGVIDSDKIKNDKKLELAKEYYLQGIISETEYNNTVNKLNEESFKKRQDNINKWGKLTLDSLTALTELNNAFAKKDEASQRKAFERNKKFSIAQALISTFLAVNGALTAGGNPVKLATGAQFVEAGIALTTGLAQVAKISKTQFQGGSGSEGGGGGVGSVPQPSAMATTTPTIGSTQLQLDAQGNLKQQAVRTYVLETDISDKQKRSKRLSQTATLGK
jgi:hypothetical protein